MKIEFDEVHNLIHVVNKNGESVTISCVLGSFNNTKHKSQGDFSIVNEVLNNLTEIIQKAQEEI